MNFNTDRDVAKFQGIARLDFSFLAGKDSLPDLEPVRRKDVSLLTVRICNQSDESGTVRIVFDVLDSRRNAVLGTPEIDHSVTALVAASAETRGDTAVIISAAGGTFAFCEALFRSFAADLGVVDYGNVTTALCRRIKSLDRHSQSP